MVSTPSVLPESGNFRIETWRGAPGGFRVGQTRDGVWWWVTPDDQPVVACGVSGVRRVGATTGQGVLAQLESWGFNLLGPGTAPEFAGRGLAHLEALELRRAEHPTIRLGGAHLPDVYDPRWAATCQARVAAVQTGRGLAGYVSDTELGWAQPPRDGSAPTRPTLLQLCLSLDARYAAYHAAWEFVLAPRGGDLEALNRAWALALPNKETLRQQTLEEQAIATPGYLLDQSRFTREFAQRYFRGAAGAVRQADPDRLFLGVPVAQSLPTEIREAAAAHVDVLLTDAVPAGAAAGPILICDFAWTSCAKEPEGAGEELLSGLERMLRGGRRALLELLRQPAVVGYLWRRYAAGERSIEAPFGGGLVYADGSLAHENVEPLSAIHAAAAVVHGSGYLAAARRPTGGVG